jgi:predicted CopG family antitoxin
MQPLEAKAMKIRAVGLDEDAYELLSRARKEGESFSDVVKRLVRPRRPLSDLAGLWKEAPKKDLEEFERWRHLSRKLGIKKTDKRMKGTGDR